MNLILIGLRGSGKTTIGRIVADRLGWPLVDLDQVTPGLLGAASVREAWDKLGQAAFREAEAKALAAELARDGCVLSLGEGTPTAPGADELLRHAAARDRIIYLRATPLSLRSRLTDANLTDRPAITGGDPLDEIERVWAQRDPLYGQLATHIVDVDSLSPEEAASRIIAIRLPPAAALVTHLTPGPPAAPPRRTR